MVRQGRASPSFLHRVSVGDVSDVSVGSVGSDDSDMSVGIDFSDGSDGSHVRERERVLNGPAAPSYPNCQLEMP